MTQKVIALTGISGVGKTTFVRRLSETVSFQHLTGGSLIANSRAQSNVPRDGLRQLNLEDNQKRLIEGFWSSRDSSFNYILFDGHSVIHGPKGLSEVPVDVFRALGIALMVHLAAEPEQICRNRNQDQSRDRPLLNHSEVREHQDRSRQHALKIAETLGVEFLAITTDELPTLAARFVT